MDAELTSSLTGGGIVLSGAMVLKLVEMYFASRRAREQKTEISPDPLHVAKAMDQERWDKNGDEHTDLFNRTRVNEAEIASLKAEVAGVKNMQGRMFDMISALYDRIIGGKKK